MLLFHMFPVVQIFTIISHFRSFKVLYDHMLTGNNFGCSTRSFLNCQQNLSNIQHTLIHRKSPLPFINHSIQTECQVVVSLRCPKSLLLLCIFVIVVEANPFLYTKASLSLQTSLYGNLHALYVRLTYYIRPCLSLWKIS